MLTMKKEDDQAIVSRTKGLETELNIDSKVQSLGSSLSLESLDKRMSNENFDWPSIISGITLFTILHCLCRIAMPHSLCVKRGQGRSTFSTVESEIHLKKLSFTDWAV